ncbi:MAG TPA: hypothetical protein VGC79_16335 [Polyangiaceae bacterium]
MRGHWWKAVVCYCVVGCGGGDEGAAGTPKPESVPLTGTTGCERYASLAMRLGCTPLKDCVTGVGCDTQAIAWIDCAAKGSGQCMCESDGDLNCEGSFKADEGPALCSAQYQAYLDCSK